ncbi:ABC transporter ATP-binding protein [Clostridium sp. BJN0001]|uniref:ATP-binding cassette domain-containing protein n=1 Tax=Clostridium sp. BJN0001 TaxID=2930219 RepID=UPI001FD5D401|nr:ABC transporter ATP-binding protein [Clostridium sp. BJN0001]
MEIQIRNLNKSYNRQHIFENFNINFTDEKVNCIIGKSGCGKSTLLNIISGLIPYDGDIKGIDSRDISYIFQEDRLIEWLTINENLRICSKKYYNKNIIQKRIDEILKLVSIYDTKDKYPSELSGGMKQRVNIARALVKPSKVILMDEPFKSLDYKIKYKIIEEYLKILQNKKRIIIMVTHDVDEAIAFNGNIIIFGDRPVKVKKIFTQNLKEHKKEIIKLI